MKPSQKRLARHALGLPTETGARLALEEGERLCPDDFPAVQMGAA
jgi:hypothetical protein